MKTLRRLTVWVVRTMRQRDRVEDVELLKAALRTAHQLLQRQQLVIAAYQHALDVKSMEVEVLKSEISGCPTAVRYNVAA